MPASLLCKRTAAVAAAAGLLAVTAIAPTASARKNPFIVCTDELQATGLTGDVAAAACSEALDPKELSLCVAAINTDVGIAPDTALDACFRSRRPDELATCTLEISDAFLIPADPEAEVGVGAAPEAILDSCRKSLLPLRFSDCATGVSLSAELSADDALKTCLAVDFK